MKCPMKVCIVGGGTRACEHVEAMRSLRDLEVVGVFDPSVAAAKQWLGRMRVPYYNDLDLMLRDLQPDFGLVSGPHDVHLESVQALAHHGVHVFKEKPLARNLREAHLMRNAVQSGGVKLFVAMQRRFSGMFAMVPRVLNHIGTVRRFSACYTLNSSTPCVGWRASKHRAGGGCILDMGYHLIDVALWYFGMPSSVRCRFELEGEDSVENEATIEVTFPSGVVGELFISRRAAPKREHVSIEGTDGKLEVDRGHVIVVCPESASALNWSDLQDWGGVLTRQLTGFIDHMRGGPAYGMEAHHHLSHVAFVEACYQSQAQGVRVDPRALIRPEECHV